MSGRFSLLSRRTPERGGEGSRGRNEAPVLFFPSRVAGPQQKKDLCTPEPRRHGESENKWFLFGPMIPGCIQNQGLDISAFSLQQKNEDTEVLIFPQESGQ